MKPSVHEKKRQREEEEKKKKAPASSFPPKICIVCHSKSRTSHGSQGNYRPWDNPRCRTRGNLPRTRPGATRQLPPLNAHASRVPQRPLFTLFGNRTWSDSCSHTLIYSPDEATFSMAVQRRKHTCQTWRCLVLSQPAGIAQQTLIECTCPNRLVHPSTKKCLQGISPVNIRDHAH